MKKTDEREEKGLYESLISYCGSEAYPLHMPGHKRRLGSMKDPFSFDITEIDGFDNLHHAEGILLEAQRRAAKVYGSEETYFLVNGSTCGILSSIGLCKKKILMARASHKAAYHAVEIGRLEAVYLYPKENDALTGGKICADQVEDALKEHPDCEAVFLTSPTYDGIVSEVREIAVIAHRYGIPLIVDAAHGAHFGMHPMFPENAVNQGADLVIHSVHKTLPSLTQTALLQVNGSLVDRRKLRHLLNIYQTSSPSYVLMASIDNCMRILEKQGESLFQKMEENLKWFLQETRDLQKICFLPTDDPSKIRICASPYRNGLQVGDYLRKEGLEAEMELPDHVLALMSVSDTEEGYARLAAALKKLDQELIKEQKEDPISENPVNPEKIHKTINAEKAIDSHRLIEPEGCMSIYQTEWAKQERIELTEAEGRISAEYIYLYPPGIPLIVPGERFDGELLQRCLHYKAQGFGLQGMDDYEMKTIRVVKDSCDNEA